MRIKIIPTTIAMVSSLFMTACGPGPGDPSAEPLANPADSADVRASRIVTMCQREGLKFPGTIVAIKQNVQTFPGHNVTSAQVVNSLKYQFQRLSGDFEFTTKHTAILDGSFEIKSIKTNEAVVVEVDPESDTHSAPIKTVYRRY
ncbi:MAG: hypothetical protein K2X93_13745 [Candidatus Obscuribacterales bacterium]|nr:hypothetical protein [Candidatus Obscuribacterales bacterium]